MEEMASYPYASKRDDVSDACCDGIVSQVRKWSTANAADDDR